MGKGKKERSLVKWCKLWPIFSGEGAAVLLRSLEPLQGQPIMRQLRAARRKEGAPQLKDKELCNGPSKLCQALHIPRCFDRRDLASDPEVWLERDSNSNLVENSDIISAPRVGIESHGEWAKKPWRFYLRGHPCVSVRNKEAEREFLSGKVMNNSDPSDVQSGTGQHNVTGTSQKHDWKYFAICFLCELHSSAVGFQHESLCVHLVWINWN